MTKLFAMCNFFLTGLTSFDVLRQTCTFRLINERTSEEVPKFQSRIFSFFFYKRAFTCLKCFKRRENKNTCQNSGRKMCCGLCLLNVNKAHINEVDSLSLEIRMKITAIDTEVFITSKACVIAIALD